MYKYYRMLCEVTGEKVAPEKIDLAQFKKFLDLNPAIRKIVKDSLKPDVWTLEGGPVHENSIGCFAPPHKPIKSLA